METPSPQSSCILRARDYARMRWKNGAGWTSEILRVPDQESWDWRLSIAEIEADAPFSAFPGIDRELVLLSGNGVRLRFEDGAVHTLLPPHDKLRFAGERALVGELVDGLTRDFNLMWRRDTMAASLWHRPLVGTMVVFVEPADTWVVHLLAGQAHFADGSGLGQLGAGDTAVLRSTGGRQRFALDGTGEALLIRLSPKTSDEASASAPAIDPPGNAPQ